MSTAPIVSIGKLKAACATCTIRELCLPIGLGPGDMARLDAIITRRRRLKTGEPLYRAGHPFSALFAIRLGAFKTCELNKDGREQVNGFHMMGELMGLDAISTDAHACSAVALEDSEVCEIPFPQLEDLFHEIPALSRQFHRLMSREIAVDQHLALTLGTLNAEERLASFLLNLSERLAIRGLSATRFNLTMSREEIGNYLGLKLETVSRMFSRFQEAGLIEVDRRSLTIKRLQDLHALVECAGPRGHRAGPATAP